jgi:nitrogen fixation protein FixH
MISQHNKEGLKNPWVLGLILFLCVFLLMNAIFIYLAFRQPPNLVVQDFYERGKDYQITQKNIEREKQLGWSGMILTPAKMRANQKQNIEAIIQGNNSAVLHLDSVEFHAYRPSDSRADFMATMQQSTFGKYDADIIFTLPGVWDVIVEAKRGDDKFLLTRRVSILP